MKKIALFNHPPVSSRTELRRLVPKDFDIDKVISWKTDQTMRLGKRGFLIRKDIEISLAEIFGLGKNNQ